MSYRHHGPNPHGEDSNENTTVAKSVAMLVLFLASFTLGNLPIKLAKWFNWKIHQNNENVYIKTLLCLGGGVLLCTTFLHVLPEVDENLENSDIFNDSPLPIATLLMCIGFFIIYFVEECVHIYINQKNTDLRRSISISRAETMDNIPDNGDKSMEHLHAIPYNSVSVIRGLLIVMALSVHELFEGLAVGLEKHVNDVWYMFGAVSAHKLVLAFCMGIELISIQMKTIWIIFYVFIFSIVSPIGIGIGIIMNEQTNSDFINIISIILQGLASGTLLYIVFFEILRNDRKSGFVSYFAVLFGFGLMVGMTMIGEG